MKNQKAEKMDTNLSASSKFNANTVNRMMALNPETIKRNQAKGKLIDLDEQSIQLPTHICANTALKSVLDNCEALRNSPEAMIYQLQNKKFVYVDNGDSKLVHRISYVVEAEEGQINPIHYVDALTGERICA